MASSYNELHGHGSHSADASTVSEWLMQESTGTSIADRVGANTGTTVNMGADPTARSGPTSWLTSAIDFVPASNERVIVSNDASLNFTSQITVAIWAYLDAMTDANPMLICKRTGGDTSSQWDLVREAASSRVKFRARIASGNREATSDADLPIASWRRWVATYDGSAVKLYRDASLQGGTTSITGAINTNSVQLWMGSGNQSSNGLVGTTRFDGGLAGPLVASRAWSSTEISEDFAGPEPVNSSAPTLSGTETEGQILTCASGTWGLPSPFVSGSNGTITYTRQWTRSNDGSGSGEADISGATSSTYTLQAGDVGKYIRCRVRATNDGGFDSAADTNSAFTGAIAGAGGGGVVRGKVSRSLAAASARLGSLVS